MNYCPYCNIGIDHYQIRDKKCNNCLHEWETWNVIPINDSNKHSEHYDCHCSPKIKIESGNMIIIHNSFDGREGVEWANEILTYAGNIISEKICYKTNKPCNFNCKGLCKE